MNNDHLGQGAFCNALWKDYLGLYCSAQAAEGRSCVSCPFTEESCHIVSFQVGPEVRIKIQCGGEKLGYPTLVGVCQDFDPSKWLRKKLMVK